MDRESIKLVQECSVCTCYVSLSDTACIFLLCFMSSNAQIRSNQSRLKQNIPMMINFMISRGDVFQCPHVQGHASTVVLRAELPMLHLLSWIRIIKRHTKFNGSMMFDATIILVHKIDHSI